MFTETSFSLLVSSCLLGDLVRYDGGHRHDRYVTDVLGRYFRLVPVCPEVGCGMGVPRGTIRLAGDPATPNLITSKEGRDVTGQMQGFCRSFLDGLDDTGLCGAILKKNSPSCGIYRVPVLIDGQTRKQGVGMFAAALRQRFPLLPLEDEGRLNDPVLRENFIEQLFCRARWRQFLAGQPTAGGLVRFHTTMKLLMMAHSTVAYRDMGKLVAQAGTNELSPLLTTYEELMMKGLALHATPRKNTNVLMHIMGYFKKQLTPQEKAELLTLIEQYRTGILPLIVPITLLRHYVMKYEQSYLGNQWYLSPHPAELMLRNHV